MAGPPVVKGSSAQTAGISHQILGLARVQLTIPWARNRSSPCWFLGIRRDVWDRDTQKPREHEAYLVLGVRLWGRIVEDGRNQSPIDRCCGQIVCSVAGFKSGNMNQDGDLGLRESTRRVVVYETEINGDGGRR